MALVREYVGHRSHRHVRQVIYASSPLLGQNLHTARLYICPERIVDPNVEGDGEQHVGW